MEKAAVNELEQPNRKRARIESASADTTYTRPTDADMVDTTTGQDQQVLSSAEAELYDRQIRLWGVEAQKRLNSAKILIIGMSGLGAEVAKNIILGGVKSVHMMDPSPVTELDASSQFLVAGNAIGENRALASLASAQRLNPMVAVTASDHSSAQEAPEFFHEFNVVCSIENSKEENIRLSTIVRQINAAFFAADVFGMFGYIALDLGQEYKYTKERKILSGKGKPDGEQVQTIELVTEYPPYKNIVEQNQDNNQLWTRKRTPATLFAFLVMLDFYESKQRHPDPANREEDLDSIYKLRDAFCNLQGIPYDRVPNELFEFVFGQVSPVCAITGGVLAQEIVKSISKRDEPICNLFLFNPMVTGSGVVVTVA